MDKPWDRFTWNMNKLMEAATGIVALANRSGVPVKDATKSYMASLKHAIRMAEKEARQ